MKKTTGLWWILTIVALPVFVQQVSAQSASRRNPDDVRREIANDTWRELMKTDRERKIFADESEPGRAARMKQIHDDFKSIQDINNRMMAQAWAGPEINFATTAVMLNEINSRAVRLKSNLALPDAEGPKRNQPNVSGVQQFKSALLGMDRSLMSFVNNPIFRETKVVDVKIAARATQDLDYVIALSTDLKKVAGKLKDSKAAGRNRAQSSQ